MSLSASWTKESLLEEYYNLKADNPDKLITRNFFRSQTGIPESAYERIFGTFSEFSSAAGDRKHRIETKLTSLTARAASKEVIQALGEERLSYGGLYLRDRGKGNIRTVLGTSDWHDEEIDPFYERVLVDMVKRVQPDVICLGGDIFDCPEFGKYPVNPMKWDPVRRIRRGHETIKKIREVAPDAQIDLIEGNHEARFLNYLKGVNSPMIPLLQNLHGMSLQDLFGLTQFQINYVAKADLHSTSETTLRKAVEEKNYKIYYDALACHHHPWGKNLHLPGFNGHHHRHKVESKFSHDRQSYEWHQLGAGHVRRAEYTDADETWNNGFVISHVYLPKKSVTFEYVDVGRDIAVGAGEYYVRTPAEYA